MIVCGIDEAGRGCLAGPLVVAGVVLREDIDGITDSKKLTPKKRQILCDDIYQKAEVFKVVSSPQTIDQIGLSLAIKQSLIAIQSAIKADRYIFDGNCNFGVDSLETIIKADLTIPAVSAASIVAKVTKDMALLEMAKDFPQFNFHSHQGYGTQKHYQEIATYGATPIHRHSFKLYRD